MPTLKELRLRSQLSQDTLGEMAKIARETINRYEMGRKMPSLETIRSLAEALRVQPEQIHFPIQQKGNHTSPNRKDATYQKDQLELFIWVLNNGILDILGDVPSQMISKYFRKKKIADYISEMQSRKSSTKKK